MIKWGGIGAAIVAAFVIGLVVALNLSGGDESADVVATTQGPGSSVVETLDQAQQVKAVEPTTQAPGSSVVETVDKAPQAKAVEPKTQPAVPVAAVTGGTSAAILEVVEEAAAAHDAEPESGNGVYIPGQQDIGPGTVGAKVVTGIYQSIGMRCNESSWCSGNAVLALDIEGAQTRRLLKDILTRDGWAPKFHAFDVRVDGPLVYVGISFSNCEEFGWPECLGWTDKEIMNLEVDVRLDRFDVLSMRIVP